VRAAAGRRRRARWLPLRLRAAGLLALALGAGCARHPAPGALADDAPSVAVAAQLWGEHVFVPVSLGGGEPVWLLLDSGAQLTIIATRTARALELAVRGRAAATGFGGDTLRGGVTPPGTSIALPGSMPYRLARPVLDLSPLEPALGRPFAGILGGDFFRRYVVEIDYGAARVTLHDPRRFQPHPAAVALPLELDGQRPYVRAVAVLPDGRELEGRFLVDTGARVPLKLYAPVVRAHDVVAALPATVGVATVGIGGTTQDREGRLRAFRIGPFTFDAPVAALSLAEAGQAASTRAAGFIGAELLRRFTVTFDYRGGVLYLRPNAHVDDAFDADMAGFGVRAAGDELRTYVVDWIDADAPAARAGLLVGDIVVYVNGRPADHFTVPELRALRRAGPGAWLRLVVRRADDWVEVPILLERRV
jgi:hypothetical protein